MTRSPINSAPAKSPTRRESFRIVSWLGLILCCVGFSGCAHVAYETRDAVEAAKELAGIDKWPFYHSRKTGEIVPKHRNSYCAPHWAPPCHGFNPTCWRGWPEECPNCPPATDQILIEPVPDEYEEIELIN